MRKYPAAKRAALSALAASAVMLTAACSQSPSQQEEPAKAEASEEHAEGEEGEEGEIDLSAEQIAKAEITLVKPVAGAAGATISAPALLESDPDAIRIVTAPIGGRVISLNGNIGDYVKSGETLAVLQSREAAGLNADVESARARAKLARANLARDEALAARGFFAKRNLDASRANAEEAEVALRNAQGQVSAAGIRGNALNRIVITSPISGQIVQRNAILGQTFSAEAAGAELFRVTNLSSLTVALSLPAGDAARVGIGDQIDITAGADRAQTARVTFISPVLDEGTKLVRILATLDNRSRRWRAGEPVQAALRVAPLDGGKVFSIPADAVQTVEGETSVFVRTDHGFKVVPITIGSKEGNMVSITSGLTGNETIAGSNSFVLKAELGKGEAGHGH